MNLAGFGFRQLVDTNQLDGEIVVAALLMSFGHDGFGHGIQVIVPLR